MKSALCRHYLLPFQLFALATFSLVGAAAASGVTVVPTAQVQYESKATIVLPFPSALNQYKQYLKFRYRGSSAYTCGGNSKFIGREVVVTTEGIATNRDKQPDPDYSTNGKVRLPIRLCPGAAQGATITVEWDFTNPSSVYPFDSSAENCRSTDFCTTTVTVDNGPLISIEANTSSVAESENAAFTLTADPAPKSPITVDVAVSESGSFTASGQTGTKQVTIGTDGTATLTVVVDDDQVDEPSGTIKATVQSGTGYTPSGTDGSASVTVSDNDTAGVTVSKSILNLSEGGLADGYTLVLASRPTADVTVTVTSGDAAKVRVNGPGGSPGPGATFTFTPTNWDQTQTVTVTPLDDNDAEDESITITHAVSNTGGYGGLTVPDVAVTVSDDDTLPPPPDTPAVSFAATSSNPSESVGTHNVTVNLDRAAPSGGLQLSYTVTGTATAGSGNDFTIQNSGSLSVGAGNTTADIPVAINDDTTDDDDETVILTLTAGTGYTPGSINVHTITIADNDGVGAFSVLDASAEESSGIMTFTVRLSKATVGNVKARVRATTREGSAKAGEDYIHKSELLVFNAGQTKRQVSITLINDSHNENPETFELVLSEATGATIDDGVAVGTINNVDYIPQTELAHFGRTVAEQVLEGVQDRIGASRLPGFTGVIAGQELAGGAASSSAVPIDDALSDSSFALAGEDNGGGNLVFWGRGGRSSFGGAIGSLTVDGNVNSFILGADQENNEWLLGLALMRSKGSVSFENSESDDDFRAGMSTYRLNAVVPYAAWQRAERTSIWGALGRGSGDLVMEAGSTFETDIDWTMAAVGLRSDLWEPEGAGSGLVTLVSDALWVKTSSGEVEGLAAADSEVTRLRLGLEVGWDVDLEKYGRAYPMLRAGLRHDGGDAGEGFGVEIGGGVSWVDSREALRFGFRTRAVLDHGSNGITKNKGFSAAIAYDPNPTSERGLSASLRQDAGIGAPEGMNALLAPVGYDSAFAQDGSNNWTAEAAYGLPALDGRFTGSPHVGFGSSELGQKLRVGWRLTPESSSAPDLTFDANTSLVRGNDRSMEQAAEVEVVIRW